MNVQSPCGSDLRGTGRETKKKNAVEAFRLLQMSQMLFTTVGRPMLGGLGDYTDRGMVRGVARPTVSTFPADWHRRQLAMHQLIEHQTTFSAVLSIFKCVN